MAANLMIMTWRTLFIPFVLTTLITGGVDAAQSQGESASRSRNVRVLAQEPALSGTQSAWTTDLAFQEDLIVAGANQGIAFYKLLERSPYVRQISFFDCPGAQQDVSVFTDYVFASNQHVYGALDGAGLNATVTPKCNNTGSAGLEGVRVVDISNIKNPKQVAFVPTACGSHTHTLLPRNDEMFLYSSAPSPAPFASCPVSILSFPSSDPSEAKLVGLFDTGGLYGCHDITIFPSRDLAAAACVNETQLWDVSEPAEPKVIARVDNESISVHHSTAFTWDGKVLLIGEETGGACNPDDPRKGALWFYDIRNVSAPRELGFFNIPRPAANSQCWTHNFNVIPMKVPGRYVASVGYFAGGLSVVDFSNPRKPREHAHYMPLDTRMWSAYWYNGRIYATDWRSEKGLYVFEVKKLGTNQAYSFGSLNPQVYSR